MCFIGKRKRIFLSLFFVVSFLFAEEQIRGRMLIMGWFFEEEDTSIQTNMAIDAIIKYAQAARYQMNSKERYNPSSKIELYRVYEDYSYDGENFEGVSVYIYINNNIINSVEEYPGKILFAGDDYHDRYIEIDFYIIYNKIPSKYKLVMYYNGYNWMSNNKGDNRYKLISRDDDAYNFFIYEIEKLRR
jgi:hypothetical protein